MFGFFGRLFGRGVRNQGPQFLEFLKTLIDRHGRGILDRIADALEEQTKFPASADISANAVSHDFNRATDDQLHAILNPADGMVEIEGRQYVAGFWGLILPVIMELFTRFLDRIRR